MPSPVGHSLIGLALGSAWLLPRGSLSEIVHASWQLRWPLLGCVALANMPDVDYVPGILTGNFNAFHHYYTHTPGWCLLVAAGVWFALRHRRPITARDFGWILTLLCSHLAADLFSEDFKEPCGIMALWPLSDSFYISPASLFLHLRKDEYSDFLQWHNLLAALREAAICLPLAAAVVLMKTRRVSSASAPHDPAP